MKILLRLLSSLFLLIPLTCYAVDASLMLDIIECESSGRPHVVGDKGKSFGIVQFKPTTFYEMRKKSKMYHLVYNNPIHQLRLMLWAIDSGYGKRWTCYRKLKAPMDGGKK